MHPKKSPTLDGMWKVGILWKDKSLFRPPIKIAARLLLLFLSKCGTRVNEVQ